MPTLLESSNFQKAFDDHATFCRESLTIRDLVGSRVPLELSPGQLKQAEAVERQERAGKPVRLVILKPRRTYFTVGSCALMFRKVPFYPGRRGLIIADKYKPAALEAFDYLLQFTRTFKPFRRPGVTPVRLTHLVKDTEQELKWSNSASFDVLSADSGEVRGGGRHYVLLDEVAFWRNAGVTLTGVLNMVPYHPNTMVIIQSTANGLGGEFYELCQKAQDPANDSGWEFLFFSWLEHPIYRMELDVRQKTHIQETLTRDERDLQLMHGASLEQLAWRRKTVATECRGNVDLFNQEYPTTAMDAFLASGRPVFDHKALSRMPISDGSAGALEVIEDPPSRRLVWIPGEGRELTVWKKPQPGHSYAIGADPSKGKDVSSEQRGANPDYSVGFVLDAGTGEQVALLRARIRPIAFAEYLALLGRWYLWAFITPEANDAGFIDALVRTGYPEAAIYTRQRDPTDRRPRTLQEIGFETTTLTRDWLVSAADESIRDMGVLIKSSIVATECRTFVVKPNGKKEHQDGCHDDCVFAMALAVIGLRSMPKKPVQPERFTGSGKAAIRFYGRKALKDEDDD